MTHPTDALDALDATIATLTDTCLARRLREKMDAKTKPLGALGRLEEVAVQIGLILGTDTPRLQAPRMIVAAADHGIAAQGVSAYPREVTAQMVSNMLVGGAAVNVLTRQHGIEFLLVDAGILHELPPHPGLIRRRIGPGTRDASETPAMTLTQCREAIQAGRELVASHTGNVLLLGEMGIGNTSAAALLVACLAGIPLAHCVGRGTGLDDSALAHKLAVLTRAAERHRQAVTPLEALAAFGGFEIALLAGAIIEAAARRKVILIDGFIVSAALLVVHRLAPQVLDYCLFSHRSAESGHGHLLEYWAVKPLLDLQMRLGEGSGAALAWPLLQSAVLLLGEMASFASAGVSQRES